MRSLFNQASGTLTVPSRFGAARLALIAGLLSSAVLGLSAAPAAALSERACQALKPGQLIDAVDQGLCTLDVLPAAGPTNLADNSGTTGEHPGGGGSGGGGGGPGSGSSGGDPSGGDPGGSGGGDPGGGDDGSGGGSDDGGGDDGGGHHGHDHHHGDGDHHGHGCGGEH